MVVLAEPEAIVMATIHTPAASGAVSTPCVLNETRFAATTVHAPVVAPPAPDTPVCRMSSLHETPFVPTVSATHASRKMPVMFVRLPKFGNVSAQTDVIEAPAMGE